MSSSGNKSSAEQNNTVYVGEQFLGYSNKHRWNWHSDPVVGLLPGGVGQDVDSQLLYATFLTFGEILDVQLPKDPAKRKSGLHPSIRI